MYKKIFTSLIVVFLLGSSFLPLANAQTTVNLLDAARGNGVDVPVDTDSADSPTDGQPIAPSNDDDNAGRDASASATPTPAPTPAPTTPTGNTNQQSATDAAIADKAASDRAAIDAAAKAKADAKAAERADNENCWFDAVCHTLKFVDAFLQYLMNGYTAMAALLLWIGAVIFDQSVTQLVIQMPAQIKKITAIYTIWQTLRDLANMSMIFIILYIAIKTILGDENYKKMMTKVIIVALFLNFSLFFTNIVVDASNLASTFVYKAITGNCGTSAASKGLCLTYQVIKGLNLGALASQRDTNSTTQLITNTILAVSVRFLGISIILVTALIFAASALIIIVRFLWIIVLMMFSSLAFAAQVLPGTEKYWTQWWEKLKTESIATPAYLLFLWVVFNFMEQKQVTGNLIDKLSQANTDPVGVSGMILNYIMVLGLLGAAPFVAKATGAGGAGLM
jgi:hypothetical protein